MIYFIKWNTKTNEISVENNFESVGGEINLKSINPKTERLFIATDSFTRDDIVKDICYDFQICICLPQCTIYSLFEESYFIRRTGYCY